MEMEYEIDIGISRIDFEMESVPFMDGQHLNETCILYESSQKPKVKEESEHLQFSVELH